MKFMGFISNKYQLLNLTLIIILLLCMFVHNENILGVHNLKGMFKSKKLFTLYIIYIAHCYSNHNINILYHILHKKK